MTARLEDVERLHRAVGILRTERRKMAKLSEKGLNAPLGKASQKLSADLAWQAMHVAKCEADVHAIAVDCGLADLREPEHYREQRIRPTGWHDYRWQPQRPRALSDQQAA